MRDALKTSSRRLGRRKLITLKTYWRRRLKDEQMFAVFIVLMSCIFMGEVRAKLDCGAILWIIFIMWSIFTSIQIFSPIHYYHISTTPAPIFLWAYFNTPAILFNSSDSVAVLRLVATLARINKRKWSIKKKKQSSKTKYNCKRLQLFYSRLPCSVPTIFS